jgi:hypothetical protein
MSTGPFAMLGPDGKVTRDLSPIERASRQDRASELAELARHQMALKLAITALNELNTHHTLQNITRGRAVSNSYTLRIVHTCLNRIKALVKVEA